MSKALSRSKPGNQVKPENGKGNPSGSGNGSPEYIASKDSCPVGNLKSDESEFVHGKQSSDKVKTSKRKKKDNSHLNKKFEVGQDNLELERSVVEKKTPSHGTDFGLKSALDREGNQIVARKTGKPRAKQNKENYEKFAENVEAFVRDPQSQRVEATYRKGRENQQDVIGFVNYEEKRFVCFTRDTGKFVVGWALKNVWKNPEAKKEVLAGKSIIGF